MDLSECRKEIDKIDKELVELFERRMNVAIKVAEYKIENNLPILNEAREAEVIEKNINQDVLIQLVKLSQSAVSKY